MKIIKRLTLVGLFLPITAFGGRVRTLPTSSQEMPVIQLMTGRSTVIRFSAPPKKVIIGNQNYFNIEFIDSDVTLQPLGNTSSNMFVYGDGFTYGFILKVNATTEYDDLVFIRAKVPKLAITSTDKPAPKTLTSKKDLPFTVVLPKKSKIILEGNSFKWSKQVKSYYADLYVTLKEQKKISTDEIKIQVLQGEKDLTTIKRVFEKDVISRNEKSRVRVFANVSPNLKTKVKLHINNQESEFELKWKK